MEKRREGIFAYTHTQYAHESRRHLQGSEEWTATALSHCTSLNLYTQIERYTNTHTETERQRERELFSCHFNFYSRLRFASSKFHREREREREREEDSLFNAVPLSHILVSTASLTLSHTTKSAMALPIGKVVVILGAGRSLSSFLKKILIQLL